MVISRGFQRKLPQIHAKVAIKFCLWTTFVAESSSSKSKVLYSTHNRSEHKNNRHFFDITPELSTSNHCLSHDALFNTHLYALYLQETPNSAKLVSNFSMACPRWRTWLLTLDQVTKVVKMTKILINDQTAILVLSGNCRVESLRCARYRTGRSIGYSVNSYVWVLGEM